MSSAASQRHSVRFTDLGVNDYPDAYCHLDGDVWVDPSRTDPSTFGTIMANHTLASPLSGDIDVFLVGGQSNSRGRGDSTTSPDVTAGTAYEFNNSTDGLETLDDPVGDGETAANTGSAWPQFGITYNTLTNREVCLVPEAYAGSIMHPDTNDDSDVWDPRATGNVYDPSTTELDDCLTYLSNNGYNPVYRGLLWSQGEDEAWEFTGWDDPLGEKYKTAFRALLDQHTADYGKPTFVAQTGTLKSGESTGFKIIRALQNEVVYPRDDARMVWDDAKTFPERGLADPDTDGHYSQAGYNEMGKEMARGAVGTY